MQNTINKNKGITLISLVITIVVLIILASVAITLSLSNNGIFNRAKQAKTEYQKVANEEETEISKLTNSINDYVGNTRGEVVMSEQQYAQLISRIETLEEHYQNENVTTNGLKLYFLGTSNTATWQKVELEDDINEYSMLYIELHLHQNQADFNDVTECSRIINTDEFKTYTSESNSIGVYDYPGTSLRGYIYYDDSKHVYIRHTLSNRTDYSVILYGIK